MMVTLAPATMLAVVHPVQVTVKVPASDEIAVMVNVVDSYAGVMVIPSAADVPNDAHELAHVRTTWPLVAAEAIAHDVLYDVDAPEMMTRLVPYMLFELQDAHKTVKDEAVGVVMAFTTSLLPRP